MHGWIKLHRVLMKKAIWKTSTPEQKVILITLLMMANHEQNEWEWQGKKFICQPGQFITSLKSIAEKAGPGITIKQVRTAIEKFEKYEFLTNESTKTGRLITIVNWELYQSKDLEGAKVGAKRGQSEGKARATNKNDKNEKNVRNNKSYSCNSIEFQLANYLFELIKKNNPAHKEPNLQKWADDMDKLLRIDKRSADEVKLVIEFAQNDSFWKANILSVRKLREKYDQLNIKRKEAIARQQQTKQQSRQTKPKSINEALSPHDIMGNLEIYDPFKEGR